MDLTNIEQTVGINGVNLSEYFPVKNSYNPVIYMHKKFLSKERKTNRESTKVEKQNSQNEVKKNKKQDKSEQFDFDKIKRETYKTKTKYADYKDPLIEQTIKFATDIIPLTIPPSTNDVSNPVYYTIKPSQRIKRKREHCQQNLNHYKDVTFNKQKSKSTIKIVDKDKYKCNEESFSARESVSRSSKSNTLDDINENKSLCFSLSESTERKHCNKEDNDKRNKKNDHQKITVSESFEAIAEDYMDTSDAKIKVHLMNDKEKQSLYENIRAPVVRVIKQCFTELQSNNEGNLDLQCLHTAIQSQETKLDRIMGKLDKFEEQLDLFGKILLEKSKKKIVKSSKLEELSQDIIEENNDISSEEELAEVTFMKKRKEVPAPIITMVSEKEGGNRVDDLAKGENVPKNYEASGQTSVRPDRLNRIPARYCWTDTVQKL
ncbi:uncharacterized protein LOC116771641 [Danaus plexippus]|uniref:uncharacterized protein LOC116771641 n=1 Tax=Danaus plexippus TaxID=13037 RepID=UPI002AB188EF|nr:uncharacterized protein LOC116771641 [Danaus plexippus]